MFLMYPSQNTTPATQKPHNLHDLLLLQADVRDLGFQHGYRSWRVIAAWCLLPIVLILLNLVRGQMTIGYVATSLVGNSLRNGFFEEFLFRGALLTRLSRLLGSAWGLPSPRC